MLEWLDRLPDVPRWLNWLLALLTLLGFVLTVFGSPAAWIRASRDWFATLSVRWVKWRVETIRKEMARRKVLAEDPSAMTVHVVAIQVRMIYGGISACVGFLIAILIMVWVMANGDRLSTGEQAIVIMLFALAYATFMSAQMTKGELTELEDIPATDARDRCRVEEMKRVLAAAGVK